MTYPNVVSSTVGSPGFPLCTFSVLILLYVLRGVAKGGGGGGGRGGGGGGGGLGDQAILPGIQAISPSHFCDDVVIVSLTSPGLATLKSVQDSDNVGTGKKIVNTQSAGVLLKITKKATTANVMCRVFVLSVV